MFKILGAVMIIFSTTIIGYLKSNSYKNRIAELVEFQKAFEMFETEVRFTKSPLCEAFFNIASNLSGVVSDIFNDFSTYYQSPDGKSANEIWDKILNENMHRLNISKNDLNVIKDFGICLGSSDVEGQIGSILAVLQRIDSQHKSAIRSYDKNSKLFQSLGIYSGVLIAILLL